MFPESSDFSQGQFDVKYDLQDSLVTEAFMVYTDGRYFQGYNIFEKSKQHKITNLNIIKLIAKK